MNHARFCDDKESDHALCKSARIATVNGKPVLLRKATQFAGQACVAWAGQYLTPVEAIELANALAEAAHALATHTPNNPVFNRRCAALYQWAADWPLDSDCRLTQGELSQLGGYLPHHSDDELKVLLGSIMVGRNLVHDAPEGSARQETLDGQLMGTIRDAVMLDNRRAITAQ